MWREKVSAKTIAEEESFLHLALRVGQLGCVFSFITTIGSNSLTFWLYYTILSDQPVDFILYGYLLNIVNPILITTSVLLAIGYYALLRSNGSKLALLYVFLSLITYLINWTFLLQLSSDYMYLYQVLSSATGAAFALGLAWILWTINSTVSDRGLLKNIIILTIVNLVYIYAVSYPISYFILFSTIFDYILIRAPSILIALIQIILVFRLFRQDQVVIIDDEFGRADSTEWL
jgi:hypothetical protein